MCYSHLSHFLSVRVKRIDRTAGIRLLHASLLLAAAGQLRADELPAGVPDALNQYEGRHKAITQAADTSLAKERHVLLNKLKAVKKQLAGRDPEGTKTLDALIDTVEAKTFTEWELQRILQKDATTMSSKVAAQIARAYMARSITDSDWEKLPAPTCDATIHLEADTGIEVKPGDVFAVLPHPTSKWRASATHDWLGYRGDPYQIAFRAVARVTTPDNIVEYELGKAVVFTVKSAGRLSVGAGNRGEYFESEGVMLFASSAESVGTNGL